MAIDGKTKKGGKAPSTKKKTPPTISESDSEEEEREEGEVPSSDQSSSEDSDSEHSVWSDSEESGEEDNSDAKADSSSVLTDKKLPKPIPSVAQVMRGAGKKPKVSSPLSPSSPSSSKKRKASPSSKDRVKKPRKKEETAEVSHPNVAQDDEKKENNGKKKRKGESPVFSDKNCDVDLYHSSPNNVNPQRIKVANNMIVTCRTVEQAEQGRGFTYDFAAITFQRKTGTNKMFEFMMPMNLAPRIIEALTYIVQENEKFFKAELPTPLK